MGLIKSIKKRLYNSSGLPIREKLKIFFARKPYQIEIPLNSKIINSNQKNINNIIKNLFDAEWYASVNEIPKDNALKHFIDIGLPKLHSPSPQMASENGVKLEHWAMELLTRSGLQIGYPSKDRLAPNDTRGLDPFKIKNEKKNKIAIVTANFGKYDNIIPINSSWLNESDFYLFSDHSFENLGNWTLVHSNYDHHDSTRKARFIKLQIPTFFEKYEYVLWVDSNVMICRNPKELLEILPPDIEFSTFKHPLRSSIVAEAAACLRFNKDNSKDIINSVRTQMTHGVKKPLLFETMVMFVQPRSKNVQNMFDEWFTMLMNGSKRDQLSLPTAIENTPDLFWSFLPDDIEKSSYFSKVSHLK